MIKDRVLKALEYDKILNRIAEYAVIDGSKAMILDMLPKDNKSDSEFLLNATKEAYTLLYDYSIGGIEYFDYIDDELERASHMGVLNCRELLKIARLLKSTRLVKGSVLSVDDENIVYLKEVASRIFVDSALERNIAEKILSEDTIADTASDDLYKIRREIKKLNEQIRNKLASYTKGERSKYLQDNVVTMRNDRFVVPVKQEYKGMVRGLVHDQSASGATVFIEPEQVVEMNNDLKTQVLAEHMEIERILADLSAAVGRNATAIKFNIENVTELDVTFAKAIYAYKTRSVMPIIPDNKVIKIEKGRHPLIASEKVVPLDILLGGDYNYLLITGPNTGGKTVTLKLIGLFAAMSMSGVFLPCASATVSCFNGIYCDIGDEQSIEQSLSTFSSHMKNIIDITNSDLNGALVLLDEIGAGTDPEEGSALALSVIKYLLDNGSYGVITTHYSSLKEYAFVESRLRNASMDFNAETFAPLYRINIGMAGTSNAIEIARRLGIREDIADRAISGLSENKINFENVLREADRTRLLAEEKSAKLDELSREKEFALKQIESEKNKIVLERERLLASAKTETRKLVSERVEEAEELIKELRDILDKDEVNSGDLIKARTLKNKLEDKKFALSNDPVYNIPRTPVDPLKLKLGDTVYIRKIDACGKIITLIPKKCEAELMVGTMKLRSKFTDLCISDAPKEETAVKVKITRDITVAPKTEINIIGLTVLEALSDVDEFLDKALIGNIDEVKVIHGIGLGKLKEALHKYLKGHPHVDSFRLGKYGEGESGVTFIKLK